MSTNIFPTVSLPGITFSSFKTATGGRRFQRAVSGRELVISDYQNPIWLFRVNFSFLKDYPVGLLDSELRLLMNFCSYHIVSLDTFLYSDRDDYTVTDETIGIGDGAKTQFQLVRRLIYGGFPEHITAPSEMMDVKLNGTPTGTYSLNPDNGVITFSAAPAAGVVITASFTYYFRCRFADEAVEFERFAHQLWSVRELRFRSVLL